MLTDAYGQYTVLVLADKKLVPSTEQYSTLVVEDKKLVAGIEQYTVNVSTLPGLADGPNWFGVVDAETRWIPGTIYNNQRFVRYRIWDGTKWQTS